MDNPLLPGFLVLVGMVVIALLGIVEHFVERYVEDGPQPAEHEGWEGEHAHVLTELAAKQAAVTAITRDTARLRRDQLPGGDAS